MKKTSLVLLAAGMGSRYGSLKQMDEFGPNGETIMDYSIYDAKRAGFNHIVFIIREAFKDAFEEKFANRFGDDIQVDFVTQELHKATGDFKIPESRQKPWGTGHALLMAQEAVDGDFAIINADDYYGVESYEALYNFLHTDSDEYCIVAYQLKNTLSDHGHVNRGVCKSDNDGNLIDVEECIAIRREDSGKIIYPTDNGSNELEEDTNVSMNMFGFRSSYFKLAQDQFKVFLEERGHEEKSELYIPFVLDHGVKTSGLKIKVLTSPSQWFGVTYKDDKPHVQAKFKKLIAEGVYPENLWE